MGFFDRRSRRRGSGGGTERASVGVAASGHALDPLDLDPGLGLDAALDASLAQAVDAAVALAVDAVIRTPARDVPSADEPTADRRPEGEDPANEPPGDDEPAAEQSDALDEEPEEPVEEVLVTAIAPSEVSQDLANRLATLDRDEMTASRRNLAMVNARALLGKLQTLSEAVWVAGPLNRPAGWATLSTVAEGAVLHGTIAAAERRKGLATRLLEQVVEHARQAGYPAITSTVWLESPAEEFALHHGFLAGAQRSVIRYQDLFATAERRRRIEDDAASYGSSYEFVTSEEKLEDGGGTVYRVIAQHLISGIFAGAAELTVTEGAPEFALNGMVRVEPAHRGHRLGTLMSVELITFVQATARKVRMVQVSHPVSDAYITTILDRLGFRVAGLQVEHRLPLR